MCTFHLYTPTEPSSTYYLTAILMEIQHKGKMVRHDNTNDNCSSKNTGDANVDDNDNNDDDSSENDNGYGNDNNTSSSLLGLASSGRDWGHAFLSFVARQRVASPSTATAPCIHPYKLVSVCFHSFEQPLSLCSRQPD